MTKKIMVVDDQIGIRLLLSEVLERDGHEVYLCGNGKEALSILEKNNLDLVFLDMKIPGMDGIEILIHIRKAQPDLKVVLMTAYGELTLLQEAMELQISGYLAKPFDIEEVRRYVLNETGECTV